MRRHEITEAEYKCICERIKANQNKRVDKRLQAIKLRYEGKTDVAIGEKLGFSRKYMSTLCADFKRDGVEEYARHKYGGNHRSLSVEEEREILRGFEEEASCGRLVTAQDIKAAFDDRLGRDTGRGYIYMLLERHQWRMAMPRGQHPKKVSVNPPRTYPRNKRSTTIAPKGLKK